MDVSEFCSGYTSGLPLAYFRYALRAGLPPAGQLSVRRIVYHLEELRKQNK
jgi:hypothetical protein